MFIDAGVVRSRGRSLLLGSSPKAVGGPPGWWACASPARSSITSSLEGAGRDERRNALGSSLQEKWISSRLRALGHPEEEAAGEQEGPVLAFRQGVHTAQLLPTKCPRLTKCVTSAAWRPCVPPGMLPLPPVLPCWEHWDRGKRGAWAGTRPLAQRNGSQAWLLLVPGGLGMLKRRP